MAQLRAVTFDLWQTLFNDIPEMSIRRFDKRVALVQSFFAAADKKVLSEAVRWALEDTNAWINNLRQTEQRHPSFEEIGDHLASHMGFHIDYDHASTLAALVSSAGEEFPPQPAEGAGELLENLHGRVKLGIISDTILTGGLHMEKVLASFGFDKYFEHYTWSDQTMTTKPQTRNFLYTLHMLGLDDPAAAVHIGDVEKTDIDGASSIGMKTIRIIRKDEDPEKVRASSQADAVAADLHEAGKILNLWLPLRGGCQS